MSERRRYRPRSGEPWMEIVSRHEDGEPVGDPLAVRWADQHGPISDVHLIDRALFFEHHDQLSTESVEHTAPDDAPTPEPAPSGEEDSQG